jgi:hypothetical protein
MGQATHLHNWEKTGNPDETGFFIQCTECEAVAFLEGEEAKKFNAAYACESGVEMELVDPFKK